MQSNLTTDFINFKRFRYTCSDNLTEHEFSNFTKVIKSVAKEMI